MTVSFILRLAPSNFLQDDNGKFNFDREKVINPETGEQVSSWYRGSETWDSKFSTIASTYEECRAECVGLYLCLNKEVLRWVAPSTRSL